MLGIVQVVQRAHDTQSRGEQGYVDEVHEVGVRLQECCDPVRFVGRDHRVSAQRDRRCTCSNANDQKRERPKVPAPASFDEIARHGSGAH